jgi:hypothetical protein
MVLTESAACVWKMRRSTIFYPQNPKIKTNHLRRYALNKFANMEMSFKETEPGNVA